MGRPANLSFDNSGALFAGQFNGLGVYRVAAGGGAGANFITRASGSFAAIVGPDNAIYTVLTNGNVVRYAPGATTPDAVPYGTGTSTSPYTNLAFDAAGRLYVIGKTDTNVYRIPAGGGAAVVFGTVPAVGPFGLAIDANGNLLISFESSPNVYTIPSTGGAATVFGTGVAGSSYSIAISATGDLYATGFSTNNVYKVPAGGGAATVFASFPANSGPSAITVSSNVLYVGTYNTLAVSQVSLPALAAPVPTMSEWAIVIFTLTLAGCAGIVIQRRRFAV